MPQAGPADRLLTWGVPRLRDLPWRHTRDPWAVLVAEVMLQQTQAARVVPKWTEFLDVFPTTGACADAALGDVLRLWQGLGYPRRAKNLHDAATLIAGPLGGVFPSDLEALVALPGVGPYTARAVLAFAFEADAAVVDTNVARVLARCAGHRLTAREVQGIADSWLVEGESWAWNQVMLDLGATICRPQHPRCDDCPASDSCAYRGVGEDPAVGSAGVSTAQSRFEGSDRQARGRLLRRLAARPISIEDIPLEAGLPHDPERAVRLIQALVVEGLAVTDLTGSTFRLP